MDAELEKQCISQTGDIWHLGKHRVICGDSTLPETYQRLLGNEKVNLVCTDLPYMVNLQSISGKIKNDEMVKVISEALDGWEIRYLGVPSCSYQVGDFEITRDGTLIFADSTDSKMAGEVLVGLASAGFDCEKADTTEPEPKEDVPAAADEPQNTTADEPASLSISMPM